MHTPITYMISHGAQALQDGRSVHHASLRQADKHRGHLGKTWPHSSLRPQVGSCWTTEMLGALQVITLGANAKTGF